MEKGSGFQNDITLILKKWHHFLNLTLVNIGFEYHFVLLSLAWWGMQANLYSTFRILDSLTRFVPLFTRPKPKIPFLGLFFPPKPHGNALLRRLWLNQYGLSFLTSISQNQTPRVGPWGSSVIFPKVHLINLDIFQKKDTGFFQNAFFHGNALKREYSHWIWQ